MSDANGTLAAGCSPWKRCASRYLNYSVQLRTSAGDATHRSHLDHSLPCHVYSTTVLSGTFLSTETAQGRLTTTRGSGELVSTDNGRCTSWICKLGCRFELRPQNSLCPGTEAGACPKPTREEYSPGQQISPESPENSDKAPPHPVKAALWIFPCSHRS